MVRSIVAAGARADGVDDWARARWIVSGKAADGLVLGIVCVLGREESGDFAAFVTLFWED